MSKLKIFPEGINLQNLEKILSSRVFRIDLGVLLVGIAIGVYAITFSYFTILQHYSFRTHAWDLGIFNQAFWTTLYDGKFFYYTAELLVIPSGSFFGMHFSPILFFFVASICSMFFSAMFAGYSIFCFGFGSCAFVQACDACFKV